MFMGVIYKTTNTLTGKVYIGKSKYNNPSYLGSGLKIVNAIKKYGVEFFEKEILEECLEEEINSREEFWIEFYNSRDDSVGYNISKGGEGGAHYWSTLTDAQRKEHNKKISESKKGQSRKPHSEETKKKMAKSFNRDPVLLKKRADARRKTYTCVNHLTKEVFVTANLAEFCKEKHLNISAMQYNARTRKTLYNKTWSCREGQLSGQLNEILTSLETEIAVEAERIRKTLSERCKRGKNNPMYGKHHSDETKEKLRQYRLGLRK